MNTSVIRLVMGLAAFALAAQAEPARPAAAAAPVDYGKGFEKLAALGLPDTATGTYARLQLNGARDSSVYAWEYEVKMQGNGWVLQALSNSPGTVVSGQARVLTVWDPKVLSKLQMAEARSNAAAKATARSHEMELMMHRYGGRLSADGRVSGTWKPVDFTNDLARALAYIEGTNTVSRNESVRDLFNDDSSSSSGRRRLEELQGPLFLLATHAWRNGRTNEANRIAAGLFAAVGDPRKVILAAVNHLADEQYEQAFDRFSGSHDWAVFQADLASLLQRYPKGWHKRAGVALLASNVAARATGSAPEIAGEGVTDADKALARDLAAVTTMPLWDAFGSLWLLDPPTTNASADVFERLAARRTAAIPMLAALADDGWLLPFGRDFLQHWGGYSGSWGSDDDAEQKARQVYDQLNRPVTRGDIALQLLRQIVIAGDNSYEIARKSPDEIRTLALEFHKAHGSESPIQLARLYFAEGSSEQRQAAAGMLLESSDTNDMALIETQLADSAKVNEHSTLLRQYVMARGAAARPLIQALAAELGVETNAPAVKPAAKANVAPNAEETAREDHGRGQYERKVIKELLALVSDQSLESVLAQMAAGKPQSSATRGLLGQRLMQGDRDAALTALLDAALKATNGDIKATMISSAQSMRRYSGDFTIRSMQMARSAAPAKPWKPVLAKHQAQWAALLADNQHSVDGASSATVAERAAEAVEELYAAPAAPAATEATEAPAEETAEPADSNDGNDEEDDSPQAAFHSGGSSYMMAYYQREPSPAMLNGVLGTRGRAFVLARAKARVAGTAAALPAYPKADAVKAPRRKELTALVTAAAASGDAGAIAKALEALTLDERLWLASALDRHTNLNARLVPFSLRIVDVTGPAGDAGVAALAAAWKGKTLEKKTVQAAVDYELASLKAGAPRHVWVLRHPSFDGVSLWIQPVSEAIKGLGNLTYYTREAKGLLPAVVGILNGSTAIWPLTPEAVPAEAPAAGKGVSEVDALLAEALADVKADAARSAVRQQERFWKAVDAVSEHNAAVAEAVQLVAVEAKPSAAAEGEGDEETE